jgi:hypothetical protein
VTPRRARIRESTPWSAAKVAGALGVLLLVLAPLAGAVTGFVFGGVAAFQANLALGFAGGFELE